MLTVNNQCRFINFTISITQNSRHFHTKSVWKMCKSVPITYSVPIGYDDSQVQ